jgi:hypothetical protein
MLKHQREIKELLILTKDNKSQVIQRLRKSVIEYVNTNEKYISEIEQDNLQLELKLKEIEQIYHRHLKDLKLIFTETVKYKRK